jgi:hypothetical protein
MIEGRLSKTDHRTTRRIVHKAPPTSRERIHLHQVLADSGHRPATGTARL